MTDVDVDQAAEPRAAADYQLPLWMQALSYPAQTDRLLIDAVFPATGVLGATELQVAQRQAGANMSVDVLPGRCVVAGGDIANQGKYVGRLMNRVNVPIAAAPSAGLTRVDLVYAHMTDAGAVGGSTNAMTVETPVTGTAASSGWTAPALPASSEPLAWITVASGTAAITTAMISDQRRLVPQYGYQSPNVSSGVGNVNTNANGVWSITLPAGAKSVAAVAVGAMNQYDHFHVLDVTDYAMGGNVVGFRAWTSAGTNPSNTTITVSWTVTWTF
jgi:hypothetical protein